MPVNPRTKSDEPKNIVEAYQLISHDVSSNLRTVLKKIFTINNNKCLYFTSFKHNLYEVQNWYAIQKIINKCADRAKGEL